ncbi:arginine deiminase family protein [Ruminiclostridium papyrosolvens DSM 2782]|nr:arginine deiminase family protein [Ruminiclostridium papyrosolvens]WES36581.1 arginine deiminase family protein [Ruminiclostridium papyrosolvens DSM 2782]
MNSLEKYGAEKLSQLKKVMLHSPEYSIRRVKETNLDFYLFDKVPDYDRFIDEHYAYRKLLTDNGVEVYELSNLIVNNRELMSYLPNLPYLNDSSVITSKGAIISTMCPGGRQYEEIVVREALTALGIPILHDCGPGEQFEGLITLSPNTLFVADTERHSKESVERFFIFALQHFQNIVYVEVPQARRFMHPDMIFNRISDKLGLIFPPAFLNCWLIQKNSRQKIDFMTWSKQRKMELIPLSDEEQQKWGTSFVTLEPNHIINYDISLKPTTQKLLESMGVRFTQFHPDALLAGGGSLRCLTLRLLRE